MNVDEVMTEIGDRLKAEIGKPLKVYDHPVDVINAPAVIVSLPQIIFDLSYQRGGDRYELPLILAIGKVSARASRANVAPYVAGAGTRSFKAALEADDYEWTTLDTLQVKGVEFDVITWAGVEYLAATFLLDITGDGAA